MAQGYYMQLGSRTYLGFTRDAPIFQQAFLNVRDKLGLSADSLPDDGWKSWVNKAQVRDDGIDLHIIGYTVVRKGEENGFLWAFNEYDRALAEAKQFTELFGTPYECLELKSRIAALWETGDAFYGTATETTGA